MRSAHRGPASELRILHWNIHSWRDDSGRSNVDAVARLVQATDAHVVSLVEVDESWGDYPSLLDDLAARTGHASIFVPTFEFGHDGPVGGFGNALLSKLPIQAVRQRQLLWPPRLYDGTEPSEPRSVLLAKVEGPHEMLWIASTHLPRTDQSARTAALRRLTTITHELTEPWLLVGDFNVSATEWLGQQSLRPYPISRQPTYPANDPTEAIDYCIAPDGLHIEVDILAARGSDHLPILVHYQAPVPSTTP